MCFNSQRILIECVVRYEVYQSRFCQPSLKLIVLFLFKSSFFFITDSQWNVGDVTQRTKSRAKHTCEICSKPCQSAAHLRMHVRVHTGEKPFVCTECGKGFTQKGSLKAHIIGRHWKSLQ